MSIVEEVNHHAVLLYGSFDGELLFVEASVTRYTLQEAMEAPSHTYSYVYHQQRRYEQPSWPTRFTLTYHPGAGVFTRVSRHQDALKPARRPPFPYSPAGK